MAVCRGNRFVDVDVFHDQSDFREQVVFGVAFVFEDPLRCRVDDVIVSVFFTVEFVEECAVRVVQRVL